MANTYRNCRYNLWKGGGLVFSKFKGNNEFRRSKAVELMPKERIFAVDTESLTLHSQLKTLLIPIHYHDSSETLETPNGEGMLNSLFESIFNKGFAVDEGPPSKTRRKSNSKSKGPFSQTGGVRLQIEPVLSVWFNLPYDFGRLCADKRHILRSVAAGADSYRMRLNSRFELEVLKMHFGSSSAFEWLIRDRHAKTIVRLLGMDLTGYWKTTLAGAAKATGVSEKIDIESKIENVYEKSRESFTEEEWRLFKEYGIGDVSSTLELYHATALLLTTIDARVVKQTGVIPSSAPGAAAKIVFAKAFDCHPTIEVWQRYPSWADQLGCDSYFGGRVFCTRPGIYTRVTTLDLKSAYPFQTALLPDPVTVKMKAILPSKRFVVDDWKGQYGVIEVSGESLDDTYPAFRIHDPANHGRLRYVAGVFERLSVTIPELVIGVLRGALRIDEIHWGVHMQGTAETSFLRKGMLEFFSIKENVDNDKSLRDMAKLLANSTYGKLIEVQCQEYMIAEKVPVPPFKNRRRVAEGIATVFCNGFATDDTYFGDSENQQSRARNSFEDAMLHFEGTQDEIGLVAVTSYIEALTLAKVTLSVKLKNISGGQGVSTKSTNRTPPSSRTTSSTTQRSTPSGTTKRSTTGTKWVGEFIREFRKYKCGQYFMPLYASQITGATSAMLGLMSACTNALQGDTDSVHVQLPIGIERASQLPGIDRYFSIMSEAGYPSPRKRNGIYEGGIEGMTSLGSWAEESTAPSEESILVRPKVYSHRFPEGTLDAPGGKSLRYKQAKHGFAKFHSPEIERLLRDISKSRDDRQKSAKGERSDAIHEAMRVIISGNTVTYDTRRSPRRLREAVRGGKEVGEFISREVRLSSVDDPNTFKDDKGFVRWKPLMR
jgi:hypothetical protein